MKHTAPECNPPRRGRKSDSQCCCGCDEWGAREGSICCSAPSRVVFIGHSTGRTEASDASTSNISTGSAWQLSRRSSSPMREPGQRREICMLCRRLISNAPIGQSIAQMKEIVPMNACWIRGSLRARPAARARDHRPAPRRRPSRSRGDQRHHRRILGPSGALCRVLSAVFVK